MRTAGEHGWGAKRGLRAQALAACVVAALALTGCASGTAGAGKSATPAAPAGTARVTPQRDWSDAVLYFVILDRFANGSGANDLNVDRANPGGFHGGDFAGVRQRLPYLKQMGVTALWLSAPYENRNTAGAAIDAASDPRMYSAYHGYWPSPDNVDYSMPSRPTPRPRVESRIGSEGDGVRVEIEDNGTGLSDAVRKRIFEPFFTTKPIGSGTGLGLSVSYFIVTEHHGGSMRVETIPGRMTNFIMHFPAGQGGAAKGASAPPADQG